MEPLDDKAFVMMLLREADEKSLKIEALSLITDCCTSTDNVDWHDIRTELQQLIDSRIDTAAEPEANDTKREIGFGEVVSYPG